MNLSGTSAALVPQLVGFAFFPKIGRSVDDDDDACGDNKTVGKRKEKIISWFSLVHSPPYISGEMNKTTNQRHRGTIHKQETQAAMQKH